MGTSLNKVCIIGGLFRDPELKFTPGGSAICKLALAVNERKKDRDGEFSDHPIFLDVDVWGKQAEQCGKHLRKGSRVAIDGRISMDSWEDKQSGKMRSKLKVVASQVHFLSSSEAGRDGMDQSTGHREEYESQDPSDHSGQAGTSDDDNLPF